MQAYGPDVCTTGCGADEGNTIRARRYAWVHEGALVTPEQIKFEDVHICSTELAAFVAIFVSSRLAFVHRGKNFDTRH